MLVHGCYYEECNLLDVNPLRSFLEFSYQETLDRISGFFTLVEQESMLG